MDEWIAIGYDCVNESYAILDCRGEEETKKERKGKKYEKNLKKGYDGDRSISNVGNGTATGDWRRKSKGGR